MEYRVIPIIRLELIILNKNDGFLLAAETGLVKNEETFGSDYEKFSLGGWYYTSTFEKLLDTDISGNPIYQRGNYGTYFSAEKFFWSEAENSYEGLAAFVRLGFANKIVF